MPSRTILNLFISIFLISACATSKANTYPTLVAITLVPEPNAESDQQFKSLGGGEPRSQGYWLIWNTCAENNQSETAKNNGGREAGWILMDDLLTDPGILIGTTQIGECQQGLKLLQSRNMQNVDMKNDVAYALAAQLIAAQLNMAVGSEYCPASDQALNEAQLLLLDLNFDGTGSYLGPPLASSKMDKARELLGQLASYNTGELCR